MKDNIFKRLWEQEWNKKTPEEKKAYLEAEEAKRKSVLYKKDIEINSKSNMDACTVVLQKDEDSSYHLRFVDRLFRDTADRVFWGYYFDAKFIEKIITAEDDGLFYLDLGADITVKIIDIKQIVKEMKTLLESSGIEIPRSYFENTTDKVVENTVFGGNR